VPAPLHRLREEVDLRPFPAYDSGNTDLMRRTLAFWVLAISPSTANLLQELQIRRFSTAEVAGSLHPARCLDGSPYAYYRRRGHGTSTRKEFLLFFGAGSFCSDSAQCSKRAGDISPTSTGSSLGWSRWAIDSTVTSFALTVHLAPCSPFLVSDGIVAYPLMI
jgi:hypothetical protein